MRGTILEFDTQLSKGLISAEDGNRYAFSGKDVKSSFHLAKVGANVDFEARDGFATSEYTTSEGTSSKSKVAAGLLAIFLGGLGIHKFYLGYTTPALIMLLVGIFGWVLLFIPNLILGIIALIEGIIYLTKSDEDFDRIYVSDTKHWF